MKIETRFDVGQEVFFIYHDMLYQSAVRNLSVEVTRSAEGQLGILVCYHFSIHGERDQFYKYEAELAASKEDLIRRLHVHQ